ncbi:ATP-binding protein [Faecalimonas sp.]
MDIKRAKQEIKDTISAYLLKDEYGEYVIPSLRQRPIFLIGAPGIGKTQIMEQVAKECGIGIISYTITHHTRQSAIGLPFISKHIYGEKEYSVTEYTMSEIVASVYDKIEKTGLKEGILFVDEINCVSETLAPAMLQFLQYKCFGNHQIPEGWIIVTAGNPPEYNKSVREFDVVTMDRVKKIEVQPDFSVWKEYAYKSNIHGAIISYLVAKPSYFYQMEMTVDGMLFSTPRGWEDLSNILYVYEKQGKELDWEVVIQYIQYPKIAKDFANYLELYHKYHTDYRMDEVLEGKFDERVKKKLNHASFDERLSIVSLLLAKLTEQFRQIYKKEREVESLFKCLKTYKSNLEFGKDAISCLEEVREQMIETLEYKKKAELLSREEKYSFSRTIQTVESYLMLLKRENLYEKEAGFEKIRSLFAKEKESYVDSEKNVGKMLENAFDFMEIMFGTSQEMVAFVTELNANFYSVWFLQEYSCERYYQYNKNVLFEEREQTLLKRIDNL